MPLRESSLVFAGGYAGAEQPGLQVFSLDEISGALNPLGWFAGLVNPSFLVVHPNGHWVYVASETSETLDGEPGSVYALSFERDPFSIRLLNGRPSGGDWPCHLQLDATARWLFVANYGSGSAGVFPILEDGSLGEMRDRVQHVGSGPRAPQQDGPHIHSVALAPNNQLALVADLGLDQIVLYRFDSGNGKLSRCGLAQTRPGAGPRHLAFHPNGQWMYCTNELNNTLAVYSYDAAQAVLHERQIVSTLPPGAPDSALADLHVSASGQQVYASNRGHNSLAVYTVGKGGHLTLVSIAACGGNWPRHFALAPGGRFVLVANQYSNEVCVLPISKRQAALGAPVTRVAVTGAACVQIVRDRQLRLLA
jgi:6-phosphogluconolactonase